VKLHLVAHANGRFVLAKPGKLVVRIADQTGPVDPYGESDVAELELPDGLTFSEAEMFATKLDLTFRSFWRPAVPPS
jgi:hypothetical protein